MSERNVLSLICAHKSSIMSFRHPPISGGNYMMSSRSEPKNATLDVATFSQNFSIFHTCLQPFCLPHIEVRVNLVLPSIYDPRSKLNDCRKEPETIQTFNTTHYKPHPLSIPFTQKFQFPQSSSEASSLKRNKTVLWLFLFCFIWVFRFSFFILFTIWLTTFFLFPPFSFVRLAGNSVRFPHRRVVFGSRHKIIDYCLL